MRRLSFTRLSLPGQPLVFISLAFIGGLILAARFQLSIRHWFVGVAVWLMAAAVAWFRRQTAAMVLLFGGFLFVGALLWTINENSVAENRVRRLFERGELLADEPIEVLGKLDVAPELAPERVYLSVAVETVSTLQRERRASGSVQVVLSLQDDDSRAEFDQLALDYGARIRFLAMLTDKRGYRNPGAPDFDQMLEFGGFDAAGSVKSPLLIERTGEGSRNGFLAWLYRVRARAIADCLQSFRQPASGILVAALFGNRHFLDLKTAEVFRVGGTFHLLVISGLHVAMIALVALWLSARLIRVRWIQYALVMALMWSYALMVGAQPSVTRAVVMLNIALIGQLLFRQALGANTLAASAMVLLVWQPRDLFNPAFQLSFLTVLMIVVVASPLYQRLQRIGQWQPNASTPYPPRAPKPVRWLAEVLFWNEREFQLEMSQAHVRFKLQKAAAARWLNRFRLQQPLAWITATLFTTTIIQVGLLPLMLTHFHRVSIVSPIANVIESALVSLLMLAGALFLLLHSIVGSLALKLAGAVNWLGWLTVKAGEPLLAWRKAAWRVPDWSESPAWIYAAYFAAVIVLIVALNEWNPLRKGDDANAARRKLLGRGFAGGAFGLLSALFCLLILHPFPPSFERGRLSVTFLDVGQGDAMLIVFPEGKTILLDSGGQIRFGSEEEGREDAEDVFVEDRIGIAESAVMPALWRRGIKRLDWIAASHGDADHVEGFADIIRSFDIGQTIRAASASENDLFAKTVRTDGLPVWCVRQGDAFEIDGARVEVLSPVGDEASLKMSGNNQSLVLRLSFGQRSFLLTGDIEKEAEVRLVEKGIELKADVLKVAHHGSRTSTAAEFLRQVKPQHTVISVAEPSLYGHPHPEVIERLQDSGAGVWRTSRCGAITISTNGNDLRVETFVKCESDGQSGGTVSR
ncbi:MAG: ComEC/Rec2 family competence protein [Blastocatellia bacterium]